MLNATLDFILEIFAFISCTLHSSHTLQEKNFHINVFSFFLSKDHLVKLSLFADPSWWRAIYCQILNFFTRIAILTLIFWKMKLLRVVSVCYNYSVRFSKVLACHICGVHKLDMCPIQIPQYTS